MRRYKHVTDGKCINCRVCKQDTVVMGIIIRVTVALIIELSTVQVSGMRDLRASIHGKLIAFINLYTQHM